MLKKLGRIFLAAKILAICATAAGAATTRYVEIRATLQPGTTTGINLSSGTIQNLNSSTSTTSRSIVNGNETVTGTLGVTGATTLSSATVTGTLTPSTITGTITDTSTTTHSGAHTFGTVTATQANISTMALNGNTIQATAGTRTYTLPDAGANAQIIQSTGSQTLSNKTLDNATLSTNMAAGGKVLTGLGAGAAAGQSVRFEQNKVVQYVFGTIAASSAAAINGTWATNLSTGMAPTSSSNKVLVWFTFPARISGTNLANGGGFTIKRNNSTDLSGGASMANMIPQVSGQPLDETITLFFVDTPATTSMTTYTIYVTANNTANTVTTCVSNIEATLILEELAP